MVFLFQSAPHANIRYRDAQRKLGQAELSCLLRAAGLSASVTACTVGGIPFLRFEADALTDAQIAAISMHSAALLLCQQEGELLRPIERVSHDYLPADLAEVLKYKGKTSAVFTRMMLNCALSASDFFTADTPLTVLDPMCGRGTTCFVALQQGMHAIGVDVDNRDLKECADYFERYLQYHRMKHRLDQNSRTVRQRAIPAAVYTIADTREHFRADDTRTLSLFLADTALTGELCKKSPAHLLVADLPYGVQHAPYGGGRAEPFTHVLRRALPQWHAALRRGGAAAISFNTMTLKKADLIDLLAQAGFTPLTEPPFDDFEHYVEQAVNRDFVVARRNE